MRFADLRRKRRAEPGSEQYDGGLGRQRRCASLVAPNSKDRLKNNSGRRNEQEQRDRKYRTDLMSCSVISMEKYMFALSKGNKRKWVSEAEMRCRMRRNLASLDERAQKACQWVRR